MTTESELSLTWWKTARAPKDARSAFAAYADQRHALRESCLQWEELRAVCASGGPAGVDELVRHHQCQLRAWADALDTFITTMDGGPGSRSPQKVSTHSVDTLATNHSAIVIFM
ncbi:hypothetical protein [Streptomyces sp. NPDC088785]|uniref:hypothetical protein n=1 Tax=Streptomyces sp. NPDC088785 TaxID=3365897 RepID=UPI0037F9BDA9